MSLSDELILSMILELHRILDIKEDYSSHLVGFHELLLFIVEWRIHICSPSKHANIFMYVLKFITKLQAKMHVHINSKWR